MRKLLLAFALMSFNPLMESAYAKAPSFEQQAKEAARKQGWPGYPDSYQDAFVAGALWARTQKSALACTVSDDYRTPQAVR